MGTRTIFYIDALNFYYGAVKGSPHKWIDFESLCRGLVPKDQIELIRYFTARVKPRWDGDRSHERQSAFLRAIRANPLIEVTEGHFRRDHRWRALAEDHCQGEMLFRPELLPAQGLVDMLADAQTRRTKPATVAKVIVREEKGSDVNLATYLMHDTFKGRCEKAIVITNDSDLAKPIELVCAEGVQVGLVNPHYHQPTNKLLLESATFEIPFRPSILASSQMPDTVIGSTGKKVHKPAQW